MLTYADMQRYGMCIRAPPRPIRIHIRNRLADATKRGNGMACARMPSLVASAKRLRMCIRIGLGGAQMPRLAASAKRVCMYIRMLTSMHIRIGIGGARMPRPLTSMYAYTYADEYVCTYV